MLVPLLNGAAFAESSRRRELKTELTEDRPERRHTCAPAPASFDVSRKTLELRSSGDQQFFHFWDDFHIMGQMTRLLILVNPIADRSQRRRAGPEFP
jgi:hypothetical protein